MQLQQLAAAFIVFKNKRKMKRKLILYTTTVLLINIGGGGVMAQNLKQQAKKKAFSPKMLVYENLKNENVLKHFKNRFAQQIGRASCRERVFVHV